MMKLLALDVEPLFTALKCFQMLLVLCEFSTEFVKCLRFAFLIRFLVLFLCFLYSGHLFRRFNLSRNFLASTISGTYQAGRREDLRRYAANNWQISTSCLYLVE